MKELTMLQLISKFGYIDVFLLCFHSMVKNYEKNEIRTLSKFEYEEKLLLIEFLNR